MDDSFTHCIFKIKITAQKYTVRYDGNREKSPYLKKRIPANSQYFLVLANRYIYAAILRIRRIKTCDR